MVEQEPEPEMVGVCSYCNFVQGYHPGNMLRIDEDPRLAYDYCKSCNGHHLRPTSQCSNFIPRNPDVYENSIWFCQGCGSGTEFEITMEEALKLSDY